ncbi:MAG: hypothetical protein IKQ49_07120 [Eubacterium sp.]|nr:hypothetical protein [Eubacterium sp.]
MKKKSGKNRIRKLIAEILVAALALVLCFSFVGDRALALLNENDLVRYSVYAARNNIEEGTLFIGIYLINIEALTDELYEKAMESASDTDQMNIYYKSEIGEGLWYDVTDGESLTDIMNSAISVSESELADLFIQYYVGSDGIMIDVTNGREVNPFDVPDPYDLTKLPELEPLWTQYTNSEAVNYVSQDDYLKGKNSETTGNKRVDVYTYEFLNGFFSMNLRDAETDGYDADLRRLYEAYKSLKRAEKDEEAALIYSLMSSVDSARRKVVMDKLTMVENNALAALYELISGKYYTTNGNFKNPHDEGDIANDEPRHLRTLKESLMDVNGKKVKSDVDVVFQPDSGVTSAIGDSIEKCQESYYNLEAKALADADSVIGHAQYAFSRQVIDEITPSGESNSINYLRDVNNISESIIKNADSEVYLLDRSLLNLAETRYETAVSEGASDVYLREVSRGASAATVENVLNTQMDELEEKRTELEFLIDAYKSRVSASDGLLYVKGCITWTTDLYQTVPNDDFRTRANGSIDSHLSWLKDESEEIRQSDDSLKSELDKLYEKKEELQRKRDQELDSNNLAAARMYDEKIAAVDRDIADAAARLGKSADSELADKIMSEALEELAKNANADVTNAVAALNGLQAYDALETLYDRLDEAGNNSGSEFRTGETADQQRANKILEEALDKLDENPDADVSDEISALYGMGATDTLSQLYDKLDELGNSSGAEYRPGTESLSELADQSLDDALSALDKDPNADMSGALALLKGLGDKDALNELIDKLDELGNNTANDFRSADDAIGKIADETLKNTVEQLVQNPDSDASSELALLKALGDTDAFHELCDKLDDLGNNSGNEFRNGSASDEDLADKILNDALLKLEQNSKADVSDAVAALSEMSKADSAAGQHAGDNLEILLDKLNELNNNSGSEFRSPSEELDRLTENVLNNVLDELDKNPNANVSDSVALLIGMGDDDALNQLQDKLDQTGNKSGDEFLDSSDPSGNQARKEQSENKAASDELKKALDELKSDPDADVSDAVAILKAMDKDSALDQLKEKQDQSGNSSGSEYRSDSVSTAALADKILNDALDKLNEDPNADVKSSVAALTALKDKNDHDKPVAEKDLNTLKEKLDELGNDSETYPVDALVAQKILNDALDTLEKDPKADVSASAAALSNMEAKEELAELLKKLDELDNDSGGAFSTGNPSDKEIAAKILEDALESLAEDLKADVTPAVAALKNMNATEELNKLDKKLDEADNPSGASMRPGGGNGSGNGSGNDSGNGSGNGSGASDDSLRMDEDDIRSALRSAFGKSVEDMDAMELATATTVVSRLGKLGNASARSLAASLSDLMRSKNSKYLYNQYREKNPVYVSLRTIGLCTAYRYFYDTSKRTATMTQGSKALIFQSGSGEVDANGSKEKLSYAAVMDGDVYIANEDAEKLLDCQGEYILNSSYAVCVNAAMEGRAEAVLSSITE